MVVTEREHFGAGVKFSRNKIYSPFLVQNCDPRILLVPLMFLRADLMDSWADDTGKYYICLEVSAASMLKDYNTRFFKTSTLIYT